MAYVILSNPRKVEGHFLVIPKRHIEKPWEMTKDETASVLDLVLFVQQKLDQKLGGGSHVRENYMPFVPEGRTKVNHIHYHIWPRQFEDRMYQLVDRHDKQLFEDLSQEEHNRIAQLLL